MKGKDFLSIADLTPDDVRSVVHSAAQMKASDTPRALEGKTVALLFEKPSLRTRVSFEVGVRQMGGECVYLGGAEVGLGVREPVADVARVLDRWVDLVVARVDCHSSLETLGQYCSFPVVNALSDVEHPCQAMADVLTIQEHKGEFGGTRVAFVGKGNNVAASLALACASVGADFVIASPNVDCYRIAPDLWDEAARRASEAGSEISWVVKPAEAVRGADVVYTDVWVDMGEEAKTAELLEAFSGYQVNEALMDQAKPDAVFMHDMPARRGLDVSDGMLDHPCSVVFDQAENRLHAQKAIMAMLFSEGPG